MYLHLPALVTAVLLPKSHYCKQMIDVLLLSYIQMNVHINVVVLNCLYRTGIYINTYIYIHISMYVQMRSNILERSVH